MTTLRETLAHFMLMSRGAYDTPEAAADALVARLTQAGYRIISVDDIESNIRARWHRPVRAAFTCRQCGMTSYNSNDIEQRYCGNCRTWETIVP